MGWIKTHSRRTGAVPALLFSIVLSAASVIQAGAQCVATTISNGVITAGVGVSGQPQNVTPQINCAGRFGVATAGTNGATILSMAASAVNQSYLTVRIDGGPTTPGVDVDDDAYRGGWDLIFGDVGTNQLNATTTNAKTDQGAWVTPPTAQGNSVLVATWTTLPGGNDTHPIPRIEIDLRITLVHDMAQYQFTVRNLDTAAHSVSLRFAEDFNVPGASDGPVFVPNQGQICNDTDLQGALIPNTWYARNPTTGVSVGATLLQQGALNIPFRTTFGAATSTNFPLYDFVPNPQNNFCTSTTGDAGSGVYFNLGRIAASASQTATTFFGKQTSTIDFSPPWAAGVEGPTSLTYDPTQPVGQQLKPNPFTVSAFIDNLSLVTLTNVQAVISLPTGLELSAGETATKSLGSITVGSETSTSWQVVPNGLASGRLTYSVAFSAGPGAQGKVVTRTIDVPALPSQNFVAGIQMVSFPYSFADPTPSVALGLSSSQFDLLRWNPAVNVYEAVSRIVPGEGYWLRLPQTQTINLAGATPISTGSPFEIKLLPGWNQIGNPFLSRVRWSDVTVISTDVGDPNYLVPLSVPAASQAGLILPTLYYYDPATGNYRFDTDFSTDLIPFQGYWVKALRNNISLLIPVPSGRAAGTRAVSPLPAGNGWKMRIAASTGRSQDTWNFLGLSSAAKDGNDLSDVEKPPFISGAVRLEFTRDAGSSRAATYAQDIQAATGSAKNWSLRVTTPAPNQDVTITWPEISTLPRGYELYVTDTASGQRHQMRMTPSLRLNTGEAASRTFVITAEPSSRTNSLLLTLSTRPGRAGAATSIEVNATQAAAIGVRIKGSNGQTVRMLTGRSASLGRSATFVWDNRDAKGAAVPAGNYLIEVTGRRQKDSRERSCSPS